MTVLCHCGRPLHYTDPGIELLMLEMVSRLGSYIRIEIEGRAWLVPRHYIALHGLRGADVATLGFPEVP